MATLFTPIQFANRQALRDVDGLRPVGYRTCWAIEQATGYFSPMARHVFVAEGHHPMRPTLIGNYFPNPQQPLWKTALKIASYVTVIIPLLMLAANVLIRSRYKFLATPHKIDRAASSIKSWYHYHRYHKPSKEPKQCHHRKPPVAQANRKESLNRCHARSVGGLIELSKQPAWIHVTARSHGDYLLTIKSLPQGIEKPLLLAQARATYRADLALLRLELLTLDTTHPYLYRDPQEPREKLNDLSQAPLSMAPRLESIGKSLFYAAVRLLAREHHGQAQAPTALAESVELLPRLEVTGPITELLTSDGPNRVISDRYLTSKPGAVATAVVMLHAYELEAYKELENSQLHLSSQPQEASFAPLEPIPLAPYGLSSGSSPNHRLPPNPAPLLPPLTKLSSLPPSDLSPAPTSARRAPSAFSPPNSQRVKIEIPRLNLSSVS